MNWLGGFSIIVGLALAANEGEWFPWINAAGCGLFLFGAMLIRRKA